jgi:hypothetical protein
MVRQGETAEEAQFTGVNEHSWAVFKGASPRIKAFQTGARLCTKRDVANTE